MTTAIEPLALDAAQARADDAIAAATAVRSRVDRGDPDVTARELTDAEAGERFASAQLDAARARDEEERARDAAEQLARNRELMQREYAEMQRGEPDEVSTTRDAAIAAVLEHLDAVRQWHDYREDVIDRARALGFRVSARAGRPSPLPALGRAIVEQARGRVDWQWLAPRLDSNETIWGR